MNAAACERFEREGMSRWDEGTPPDEHESGCPDCQRARAAHDGLVRRIAALPQREPPAGWEQRVLERVAAGSGESVAGRRTLRWFLLAAGVAAACVAVALSLRSSDEPLALSHSVLAGAPTRRADSPVVGDRLRVHAATGSARHAELRLYRGERQLLLRCPGDARCQVGAQTIDVEIEFVARGRYRALLLFGEGLLPEPAGSIDDDARAAQAAGAETRLDLPVDVE